jgi:hypothetical protein
LEAKIDVEGVEDTVRLLKQIEPELYKKMIAEVKNEPGVASVVSGIKSRIPSVSPLQGNQFGYGGMIHNGRTGYKGAKVSANFKPSAKITRSNERAILTIGAVPPKDGVGFEIIDMVGRGPKGGTRQGQGMQSKLPGSPSRYVWKGFEEKKEGITRAVVSIIEKYSNIVNVKLKVK